MAIRVIAIKASLLIVFCLFGFKTGLAEQSDHQLAVMLDDEYQQLVEEIYLAETDFAATFNDLESLWVEYQKDNAGGNKAKANGMILASIHLFSAQPDHALVISFVDDLLQHNERQLAQTIYGRVEAANAPDNLTYLNYIFAKYYARQRDWPQVNRLLAQISVNLAPEDADYAYLLQGLSRQFLKEHRQSIESYNAISRDSDYFVHARLNIAVANIRQGWITEAQSIIKKLIPVSRSREKTELTNRMFVVLGYALLQQEYFRDARNAFGNVESDSTLTNRALFGTALSAISQGDLEAGLTAVDRLKQSERDDLSRDEAYLLLPYLYERLDQKILVEDSFSAAIKHYQARILGLEALKHLPLDFTQINLEDSGALILQELEFDFSQQYPAYLLTNRHNLDQLSDEVSNTDLSSRIGSLADQHDQLLHEIITSLIDQQIAYLNSYLNQARYGLARHYDNQNRDLQ